MTPRRKGRRLAVVVGINAYPAPATLAGCVNDADAMRAYLGSRGFDCTTLTDADATYAGIVNRLVDMVEAARAGDVLAFYYSGHGSRVPDRNGDEGDGWDEALVPVDYLRGAFLVDDDLRAIFDRLPAGVTLTVFLDSCYSGTATRLLGVNAAGPPEPARLPSRRAASTAVVRPKYLVPSTATRAAHERFRAFVDAGMGELGAALSRVAPAPAAPAAPAGSSTHAVVLPDAMRHATVSACLPQEVAYETDGAGVFTSALVRTLRRSGSALTLGGMLARILDKMGAERWQTPTIDSPEPMRRRTLVTVPR